MLLDFTSRSKDLKNLKLSSELARLNAEALDSGLTLVEADVEDNYSDAVGGPWDLPPAA